MTQSDGHLTADQEVMSLIPTWSGNILLWRLILFMEIDLEVFSMVILSLLLIQEGQVLILGKKMCSFLVTD